MSNKAKIRTIAVTLVMAFLLVYAAPSKAGIVMVTNTNDSGPGSLRAAIEGASPGDTINFSLTYPATITLATGTLDLGKNLTISGPGPASLAVSGSGAYQIFKVESGVTAAISGLTIESGVNSALVNSGSLTIDDCTFANNSSPGWGGAIEDGVYAVLTINNSTFSQNSAGAGGAIFNYSGTITVTGSTFSGNTALADGGGAIFNNPNAGVVTIINSTFFGNSAPSGQGGAVVNRDVLRMSYTTLTANSATQGAGIANGGDLTLKSTILANGASSGSNCYNSNQLVSAGYNLSDDGSCGLSQTTDRSNTPPGLDPNGLGQNGGATQTVPILSTSPAVNAVPVDATGYCTAVDGSPVMTDQTGMTRPLDASCDIGAYEYRGDTDKGLASLLGPNTFMGAQTVNGTVTATSFIGDGSQLTGITVQTAQTANTASYATSAGTATTAATASNALSLGGVLASNYARLDTANSFTSDQNIGGNLSASGSLSGASGIFTGNVGIGATNSVGKLLLGLENSLDEPVPNQFSIARNLVYLNSEWKYIQNGSGAAIELETCCEDNGGISFYTAPSGTAGSVATVNPSTMRMAIQNDGTVSMGLNGANVGIGTTSPSAKLEVNGAAKFDGAVTFAAGQAFPGAGTVTNITAATGLTGGGSTGSVTLAIDPTVVASQTDLSNGVNTAETFATNAANTAQGNAQTFATSAAGAAQANATAASQTYANNTFVPLAGGTMTGTLSAPSVNVSGSTTTAGSTSTGTMTIGSGGTPITGHISFVVQHMAFNTQLKPGTCTIGGFYFPTTGPLYIADGDTVAVGMPSSLMYTDVVYSAWAVNFGVELRICNPTGKPVPLGFGDVRFDVWKH